MRNRFSPRNCKFFPFSQQIELKFIDWQSWSGSGAFVFREGKLNAMVKYESGLPGLHALLQIRWRHATLKCVCRSARTPSHGIAVAFLLRFPAPLLLISQNKRCCESNRRRNRPDVWLHIRFTAPEAPARVNLLPRTRLNRLLFPIAWLLLHLSLSPLDRDRVSSYPGSNLKTKLLRLSKNLLFVN